MVNTIHTTDERITARQLRPRISRSMPIAISGTTVADGLASIAAMKNNVPNTPGTQNKGDIPPFSK